MWRPDLEPRGGACFETRPAAAPQHDEVGKCRDGRQAEERREAACLEARTDPLAAKSLADPAELFRRRAMLRAPRLTPLQPLLADIRAAHGKVPDPDPLDGGVEARLLLLLETPGPRIRATGLVSRDNPAETAANLFRFLAEARIARGDTLIWNAVPWVIHEAGALNRAPRRAEIAAGLAWLGPLLDTLPRLAVAVMAGRVAAEAAPVLARLRPGLPVLHMPHPSPTFLCTSPAHPVRVRAALREAARCLADAGATSVPVPPAQA